MDKAKRTWNTGLPENSSQTETGNNTEEAQLQIIKVAG